jgi:IS5 family transposase
LNSHFETKAGERSNKLADAFGLNKSALKEETDALRKAIATGTQADTATALNKLAGKAGDIEKLFNDSQAREQVVEAAKKLGISNPKADSKEDLQELMRQIKEKESSRYPGTLSNVGSD